MSKIEKTTWWAQAYRLQRPRDPLRRVLRGRLEADPGWMRVFDRVHDGAKLGVQVHLVRACNATWVP